METFDSARTNYPEIETLFLISSKLENFREKFISFAVSAAKMRF